MAKKTAKAKAPKGFDLLRKAGYGDILKTQKTKLWDFDNAETIIDDITDAGVDVELFMGTKFNSFFVILRSGTEASDPISFTTGSVDPNEVDLLEDDAIEKNGEITAYNISDIEGFLDGLGRDAISVVEVEALRDEDDLETSYKKGDKVLRAVLI